jgi:hypothetical protein
MNSPTWVLEAAAGLSLCSNCISLIGPASARALGIKMNVITELEAHFGVPFPPGYSGWSLKKYTGHRKALDHNLRVHEAEWIPPDEIPHYDLGRPNTIPA